MPFLDWVNKNQAKAAVGAVPTHLLQQEAVYGGSEDTPPENLPDNLIIQGDNLLALKALIPVYAGRVKCIFIDPPYNTQSAFEHYDDKLEHSQWLSMMYPRLALLRDLLAEDGSIWVTIDDNEAHYLKVLMDEVFGRRSFLGTCVWQHSVQAKGYSGKLSVHHNYCLAYGKAPGLLVNDLPRQEEHNVNYRNPDSDPRGPWRAGDVRNSLVRPNLMYDIRTPSGKIICHPPKGWRFSKSTFESELAEGKIMFSADESRIIRKIYLSDQEGRVPESVWFADHVGTTREANGELRVLSESFDFATPKPERLIERILRLATVPSDLVLDSFLGSGTTAAVAHKMNRRYIGIEMGEHARTHCIPRLQKVIDGEQGGISEAVGWKGGGGFRFCTLGQAAFDADGRINPEVRFGTLAAFIWHYETATPAANALNKPRLGRHAGTAYYLLYNGILGDRRPQGGNVLTHAVLQMLNEQYPHDGPKVIYGETTRLGDAKLAAEGVTFRQIPYDIKSR